MRKELCSCIL